MAEPPSVDRTRIATRMRWYLAGLRCWWVGHTFAGAFAFTYARPGVWRCFRCRRFVRPDRPLTERHRTLLKTLGWTEAEIHRVFPLE